MYLSWYVNKVKGLKQTHISLSFSGVPWWSSRWFCVSFPALELSYVVFLTKLMPDVSKGWLTHPPYTQNHNSNWDMRFDNAHTYSRRIWPAGRKKITNHNFHFTFKSWICRHVIDVIDYVFDFMTNGSLSLWRPWGRLQGQDERSSHGPLHNGALAVLQVFAVFAGLQLQVPSFPTYRRICASAAAAKPLHCGIG